MSKDGDMGRIIGVVTTGIYCLADGCSGRPLPSNTRRFDTAVAAEASGLRSCHLCRPYRQEPLSTWVGTELICRAVRLILDGALHGANESELAAELGVSARHLRRRFLEEVGTTPVQLARSSRAHFARRLLDDTDLSITEIAFAAGFGSVRQFNRTMQEIFREPPRRLRQRRRSRDRLVADGGLPLRLPVEKPIEFERLLAELEQRAIPGVEAVQGDVYRRIIEVDGAPGVLEILPGEHDYLLARLHLPHWEGLIHLSRRARRIFRLDEWEAVDAPGAWDAFEVGVASILQRTGHLRHTLQALVSELGTAVPGLGEWDLTHMFPGPDAIADADLDDLGDDTALLLHEWAKTMSSVDLGRLDAVALAQIGEQRDFPRWLIDDVALRLP